MLRAACEAAHTKPVVVFELSIWWTQADGQRTFVSKNIPKEQLRTTVRSTVAFISVPVNAAVRFQDRISN